MAKTGVLGKRLRLLAVGLMAFSLVSPLQGQSAIPSQDSLIRTLEITSGAYGQICFQQAGSDTISVTYNASLFGPVGEWYGEAEAIGDNPTALDLWNAPPMERLSITSQDLPALSTVFREWDDFKSRSSQFRVTRDRRQPEWPLVIMDGNDWYAVAPGQEPLAAWCEQWHQRVHRAWMERNRPDGFRATLPDKDLDRLGPVWFLRALWSGDLESAKALQLRKPSIVTTALPRAFEGACVGREVKTADWLLSIAPPRYWQSVDSMWGDVLGAGSMDLVKAYHAVGVQMYPKAPTSGRLLMAVIYGAKESHRSHSGEPWPHGDGSVRDYPTVMAFLLDAGVPVDGNFDVDDSEQPGDPLLEALDGHEPALAKLLLDRGAHVNLPSRNGRTALGMARGRCPELVPRLLALGAEEE